ncbi:hypothetical protein LINGRAHAP2_LOCUS27689 [Linum grandiflorum]
MEFMAAVFEKVYNENGFHQEAPDITGFEVEVPEVPQQVDGDNCGLWVCSWMINANNGYKVGFGQFARMHLALNLVMGFENHTREKITRLALERWKSLGKQQSATDLFTAI